MLDTPERLKEPIAPGHNPEQARLDDATTWLAEALDGRLRTAFEYAYDGQELYGRDGRALGPIFEKALDEADRLARQKPNLVFEARRRQLEWAEYQDMLATASGDAPNTMVVVSDFPAELMDAREDVGGYNVRRRQTMLRVIYKTPSGSLNMVSQSLDLSDRQALENIYWCLGVEPAPGELLGQRVQLDLAPDEQAALVDRLTTVYDNSLRTRWGGQWQAGRLEERVPNTYDFVCAQTDLLAVFQRQPTALNLVNLAAALEARYEKAKSNQLAPVISGWSVRSAQVEIDRAGCIAATTGKVYSGCGLTLTAAGLDGTLAEARLLGYGNQVGETTEYKFDQLRHCLVCQAPPKKDEPKKLCGPCGICRTCDQSLRDRNSRPA